MTEPIPELPADDAENARHGWRSELNWEGGSGRQPYANQGRVETPGSAAAGNHAQGNRANQSGQNQDQLARVKRKP